LSEKHPFSRLELLVGPECVAALAGARVIVFGVGGVGSWCAEALVRSGIHRLTIVDSDVVCVTNINRQLPATSATVGMPKVDVLADRLREINPNAEITALQRVYNRETKGDFDLGAYDYVIDAIDSLSGKVELIISASEAGATLFSALGAACKINPALARVSSIWKSDKCKLGRFVRKRLRRRGFKGDFLCVWSGEEKFCIDGINDDDCDDDNLNDDGDINDNDISGNNINDNNIRGNNINGNNINCNNVNDNNVNGGGINNNNPDDINTDTGANSTSPYPTNRIINGSIVHVTGVFGFMLSGLVVQDIINRVRGAGG